jgi:hypothetical protein
MTPLLNLFLHPFISIKDIGPMRVEGAPCHLVVIIRGTEKGEKSRQIPRNLAKCTFEGEIKEFSPLYRPGHVPRPAITLSKTLGNPRASVGNLSS